MLDVFDSSIKRERRGRKMVTKNGISENKIDEFTHFMVTLLDRCSNHSPYLVARVRESILKFRKVMVHAHTVQDIAGITKHSFALCSVGPGVDLCTKISRNNHKRFTREFMNFTNYLSRPSFRIGLSNVKNGRRRGILDHPGATVRVR